MKEDINKPIVFYVPGLYSSTLRPTNGRLGCFNDQQWNPPKSLTATLARGNNGHAGLALPITWKLDKKDNNEIYVQDQDDIIADDCLYFVQDKLLQTLDTLDKHGLIEFHKVVWDWRRAYEEAVKKIADQIKSLCCHNSNRKAIVVTHSTGALVTWPTIHQHPEWFSCWINLAGCLTKATNVFLDEFTNGYSLYSGALRMLSKEAFFTFPGLYSYFPVEGEEFGGVGESDYVDCQDGTNKKFYTHKDFDIYKVETWEEYKLGIFGWKKKGEVTQEERDHIQHSLDAAKRLRETIVVNGGKNIHDPSFLDHDSSAYDHLKIICYGTDKLTAHSAYEINGSAKTLDVSKSKLTAPGDGTLFASNWKTVPGGLKTDIIMAEDGSDHVTLVNDKKLQAIMVDSIFANHEDEVKRASAKALLNIKI